MAVCAICGGPLVRGDISIAGSEVFHKACIRTHGTASSALQRARNQALAADQDKHAAAVQSQQTLERRDDLIRDLNEENRELRKELAELEREVARQQVTILAQRSQLIEAQAERDQAERDRDQAYAARDAAQREAALHQAIQRASIVSPRHEMVPTPVEVDERDPTEVRMSLLDLDLDKSSK